MKLAGYEAQAFKAWKDCQEDFSILGFKTVASRAGLDPKKVRRAVRGLARKGLVEFHRVSWTDEGVPCGAGYGLTKAGLDLREVAA
ncbi:hypothetical protein AB4Z13_16065 [Rhizobium sp. YAF28]|uniref:hypothetical protein n=1 Tax=Rhizobium sp. YAF28 TaxID=3233081 RepID=UPI003F9DA3BD